MRPPGMMRISGVGCLSWLRERILLRHRPPSQKLPSTRHYDPAQLLREESNRHTTKLTSELSRNSRGAPTIKLRLEPEHWIHTFLLELSSASATLDSNLEPLETVTTSSLNLWLDKVCEQTVLSRKPSMQQPAQIQFCYRHTHRRKSTSRQQYL